MKNSFKHGFAFTIGSMVAFAAVNTVHDIVIKVIASNKDFGEWIKERKDEYPSLHEDITNYESRD